MIDRHPANAPIWWLCGRTLLAADPADEVWRCHSEFQTDPTISKLSDALPPEARVAVIGWPDRLGEAFIRRGDVGVRVIDVCGDGSGFARTLERAEVIVDDIAAEMMAPAVAASDLLVLEAMAVGPTVAACATGSWAAAAVAASSGVDVWVVACRGRVMPPRMWSALTARLGVDGVGVERVDAWDLGFDLVPLDLVSQVAGERGLEAVERAVGNPDVPDVAELSR